MVDMLPNTRQWQERPTVGAYCRGKEMRKRKRGLRRRLRAQPCLPNGVGLRRCEARLRAGGSWGKFKSWANFKREKQIKERQFFFAFLEFVEEIKKHVKKKTALITASRCRSSPSVPP